MTEKNSHEGVKQAEEGIKQSIDSLVKLCHMRASEKKWWKPGPTFIEALMLVVSELSEALEDYRNGLALSDIKEGITNESYLVKPLGIPIEMADAVIRIFDICGAFNIPLGDAVIRKLEYNRTRTARHGGKRI